MKFKDTVAIKWLLIAAAFYIQQKTMIKDQNTYCELVNTVKWKNESE